MNSLLSGVSAKIRRYAIGLGIIILAIVLFVFLKATKPVQPGVEIQQKVWPVNAITVSPSSVAPIQVLYGTIESSALVTASSPVSGVVESVWISEGETIFEGQKLIKLSDADIELPYELAKADVADMEAQLNLQDLAYSANREKLAHEKDVLEIKRKEVQRNRDLIKKQLISQATLDNANEALVKQEYAVVGAELSVKENKAKVDQLKARLEKARINLEQARINLSRGVVVAPYPGRIASLQVSEGDRVAVNAPMISYYAYDSLELRAKIPASQLKRVYLALENHQPLSARFDMDEYSFELPFKRLAGESSTSGVDAFFKIPAELKITRPGDLLKVQLQGEPVSNAFAVPYAALYGSDRIYQVTDQTLQAVNVEFIGDTIVNGQQWALLTGDLPQNAVIAITHLPNAISGLKVAVTESE
jgi:HlyD family secretion protein